MLLYPEGKGGFDMLKTRLTCVVFASSYCLGGEIHDH